MNVLVLDDKSLIVKDTIRTVKAVEESAVCFGFTNANEALSFCENTRIDIVILDIDMPQINGIEFAETLTEKQPGTNIIFVTGFPKYSLDAFRVFASDFLLKPLKKSVLKKSFDNLRNPVRAFNSGKVNPKKIGDNIRESRETAGMSVRELADEMDVSFQTVYRWESGERLPETANIVRIAKILNVSADELLM